MATELTYRIFTGPMDEDWLVAELYFGEEHMADLLEWGEKLVIYPRINENFWSCPVDEFLEVIKHAKEAVRFMPKDSEDEDEQ